MNLLVSHVVLHLWIEHLAVFEPTPVKCRRKPRPPPFALKRRQFAAYKPEIKGKSANLQHLPAASAAFARATFRPMDEKSCL
ncbi:hypothetical protein CCU68_01820 [Pseudomonas gingeri NCPPB 3146 = LMG 5327]|uniref:Uncharacterized protein n=1 Tax=Pseudomonas gingeri NCPPB 3146 = LMG 5327 TaxID=707248 RepID=A0ABX4YBD1_9PSED|nr:hypothetical protein CCU68_01820 [Pseudomonas gingeri NCPPB 3146 = LMG 5327]